MAHRFRVGYNVTDRTGKRKMQVRNVEVEGTNLDKKGLAAIKHVLTISHAQRADETVDPNYPNPEVELVDVVGMTRGVKGTEWSKDAPVEEKPKAEVDETKKETSELPHEAARTRQQKNTAKRRNS